MDKEIIRRMKPMITSVKNEKVKQWKKLHKRKERTQAGAFLVEGFHLVEEAVKSNWTVREVIIQEGSSCQAGQTTIQSFQLATM